MKTSELQKTNWTINYFVLLQQHISTDLFFLIFENTHMQASDRRGTKRTSELAPEPDPKLQNARRLLQAIIDVCEAVLQRIQRAGDTPVYEQWQAFRFILQLQSALDRFADAETAAIGAPVENNVMKSLIEQLYQSARQMLDKSANFDADKLNALVEQLTDTVVVHETLSQLLGLFGDPSSYVGALGERRLLEAIARSSKVEPLTGILSVDLEDIDTELRTPIRVAVLRERNQLMVAANFNDIYAGGFVFASDVAMDNVYFRKETERGIVSIYASDRFWYIQQYGNSIFDPTRWFHMYDKDGKLIREAYALRTRDVYSEAYVLPMCERKSVAGRALIVYDFEGSQMRIIEHSSNARTLDLPENVRNGNRGIWIDSRGPADVVWVHSTVKTGDSDSEMLLRQAIDLSTETLLQTRELRLKTKGVLIGAVLIEYDSVDRPWLYYAQRIDSSILVTCVDPTDGAIRWESTLLDEYDSHGYEFSMVFDARGQLWTTVEHMIRCYRVMDSGLV